MYPTGLGNIKGAYKLDHPQDFRAVPCFAGERGGGWGVGIHAIEPCILGKVHVLLRNPWVFFGWCSAMVEKGDIHIIITGLLGSLAVFGALSGSHQPAVVAAGGEE